MYAIRSYYGDFGLPDTVKLIIISIRLPRILLAAIAGAGLAAAGAVFQAVFQRNNFV